MQLEPHSTPGACAPAIDPGRAAWAPCAGWELVHHDWSLRELDGERGDLRAQLAALCAGVRRLVRVVLRCGPAVAASPTRQ